MLAEDRYHFDLSELSERLLAADAEAIFDAVWRTDFSAPGFCLLDMCRAVDSHRLRSVMLELRDRLNEVAVRRGGGPFSC